MFIGLMILMFGAVLSACGVQYDVVEVQLAAQSMHAAGIEGAPETMSASSVEPEYNSTFCPSQYMCCSTKLEGCLETMCCCDRYPGDPLQCNCIYSNVCGDGNPTSTP